MQPIPQAEKQVQTSEEPQRVLRNSSVPCLPSSGKTWLPSCAAVSLLSAMLVFALLVILIFNFALELDAQARSTVTAGVLWVTFAFAGTLGLNRSMAMEKDRGCLDGLLLAPVDRSAIYFGKAIGNLIFMLIVEAIVLPVYTVLYSVNLFIPGCCWSSCWARSVTSPLARCSPAWRSRPAPATSCCPSCSFPWSSRS